MEDGWRDSGIGHWLVIDARHLSSLVFPDSWKENIKILSNFIEQNRNCRVMWGIKII